MMLWKCCTQYASKFGKLSSGHRTGKISFHSNPKEGQYQRMFKLPQTVLISHASKVMPKILQARLQQYVNCELPDLQAGFRKGRWPEIKLPTSVGSSKQQQSSRKTSICFIDYPKDFHCVDHNKLWKILKERNTRPPDLPLKKSVCRSGSNS